ncbi:MAG: RluA family pseudouridine synthase [Erysipelotrichales bacterium]|nr:RluA family pseudouridine synthase [Erysipelotrichales bacterium]
MKVVCSIKKDNDLISSLMDFGFSYDLSHYLYRHKENILVNNKPLTSTDLKIGDVLIINLVEENKSYGCSSSPLNIVYEDDYLLIVSKRKNQATIPTINHYNDNLSSDVANYYLKNKILSKIHCVTRLDYETSGLVIFAKHQYIHNLLMKTNIEKYYVAKVRGIINENGCIKLSISKDPNDKKKRIISSDGKESVTEYEIIGYDKNCTLVKAHLLTGRTHQIRVHFSSIGHPLVGDSLYGNDQNKDLELECYNLIFVHPISKKLLNIKKENNILKQKMHV